MTISVQDRERISKAVGDAEDKTSGEIVCVLAKSSTADAALPILVAVIAALVLPWLLVACTAMTVKGILSLQVAAFLLLWIVFSIPRVRASLLPGRLRRQMAYRAATEQFTIRGIARKKDRCGILIFVSLAERYVRIIADDGIAARVPQSEWQAAVDALVAHVREDRIGDGFVAAIELCGEELATHFPSTGPTRGELTDRLYLV